MPLPQSLPQLDEDFDRVLCVVAHPDDLEYGTAAAVARWRSQGRTVTYLLATRGEAGIDGLAPEEAAPLREQEERTGAHEVGVEVVEFLDHRDGVVEYGPDLRRDIARVIRRHRPELVVSTTFDLRFAGGMTNQADHRAVGLAVLDAARDAGNRWIFPELVAEGFLPWGGVRKVAFAGSATPTHGVDTTGHLGAAIRSLEAHEAYLRGLGEAAPDVAEFLGWMAAAGGAQLGTDEGVLFEVFDV